MNNGARWLAIHCLAALLGAAAPGGVACAHPHAAEPGEPPARELPQRFYGRAALGIGWANLDTDGPDDFEVGGFAVALDAALGVRLIPDLSLHVSLYGAGSPKADAALQGRPARSTQTLQIAGFGLGVTYHLHPVDAFISLSAGLGWTLIVNPEVGDTGFGDVGFSSSVIVGKEFPVGDRVFLGGGLSATYVAISKGDRDYDGLGGGLMLTASYR